MGWQIEEKMRFRRFPLKDGENYSTCIQGVLLRMTEERGKLNGHLKSMMMNASRESEPCL